MTAYSVLAKQRELRRVVGESIENENDASQKSETDSATTPAMVEQIRTSLEICRLSDE